MLKAPPQEPRWVSWLLVVLWSLLILATVPFARAIQRSVTERWGRESFVIFNLGVLVVLTVALLIYLWRLPRRLGRAQVLWLVAVLAVYVYTAVRLPSPEEALHFLEYGVLGVLAFRALSHTIGDSAVYLAAVLVCALVGTIDEALQWMTPDRYGEIRDVGLNVLSAALAQVAIWKSLRPVYIEAGWSAESVRWLCRLGAVVVILLALCALNTPERVERYAARIPALGFLAGNPSVMVEYGYRYEHPEIGSFYSRLTLEELARQDRERAGEAAAILDDYHDHLRYPAFLTDHPASRDPFLNEARVHLFRRDRYTDEARKSVAEGEINRELATVAWREHLILGNYFPQTLRSSSYILSRSTKTFLRRHALPEMAYQSAVGKHLLTRVSEPQLLALAVILLVGLVGVDLYLRRRHASPR
ncbi:MAG: VanZ family protein [Thermoanaerobaculia bacterium]